MLSRARGTRGRANGWRKGNGEASQTNKDFCQKIIGIMEFHFTVKRVAFLIALIVGFYFLGGFDAPSLAQDSVLSQRRVTRAWFYGVVLFLTGAVSATIVDHFVGTMDRSNLRVLYIIMGVIVMVGSSLYIRGLNDASDSTNHQDEQVDESGG